MDNAEVQSQSSSTRGKKQEPVMTDMQDGAFVVEKDFKSERTHQEQVTGIAYINDREFFTSSMDSSLKIWDKLLQGISYTYETFEPLHSMGITGEHKEFLVVGLGEGNFSVYGLDMKNQMDIRQYAHEVEITQIVTLGAHSLKNKYFATRDRKGHVKIWSSSNHPDRLFSLWNFDADEEALAPLQPKVDVEEQKVVKKKKVKDPDASGDDDEEGEEEEEGAEDEEEEEVKKPKGPQKEIAPILIGAPEASEKDCMIEVIWSQHTAVSTALLCATSYKEKQTVLCVVVFRKNTREILKTFKNKEHPTCIFQGADSILFVGTEKGMIEFWSFDDNSLQKQMQAHADSEAGISQIVELKNPGSLITRSTEETSKRFLVSTAFDKPEFKIWTFDADKMQLEPHIMIRTSFTNGIRYVLETSPEQIVCVDTEKTLKFYDFKHENEKRDADAKEQEQKQIEKATETLFNKADEDKKGYLEGEEICRLLVAILSKFDAEFAAKEETDQQEAVGRLFAWMDRDKNGKIDFREFKCAVIRAFHRQLPPGLLEPLPAEDEEQ